MDYKSCMYASCVLVATYLGSGKLTVILQNFYVEFFDFEFLGTTTCSKSSGMQYQVNQKYIYAYICIKMHSLKKT